MDKAAVREIATKFAEEVRKVLDAQTIILFGSHVNGIPHEYSDIDIAVVLNDFEGDWLETASMLVGLSWDVNGDIEPHLMVEAWGDRSGFLEHIRETGEVIYEAA